MNGRLILVLSWVAFSATALAAPDAGASPVCLYQSKAFSEGAFVCVQKSLMQVCSFDGVRMTWKTVPDRDISDRCMAASFPRTVAAEPGIRRHHVLFRRIHPLVEPHGKCFMFNDREYCE